MLGFDFNKQLTTRFEFISGICTLWVMKLLFAAHLSLLALIFLGGCATPAPNAEFVKTVNFSSLETFSYKHSLISGMDFRESEEMLLEELSELVIVSELQARGFEQAEENADFYAVVKWKKAVSSYPSPFNHVDGAYDSFNRRDNPTYKFNSRMHVTLEIYESSTRNLFWRNDLPNIFDAIRMTEERVAESLKRSIKNFPDRIEKDPNLPDIE